LQKVLKASLFSFLILFFTRGLCTDSGFRDIGEEAGKKTKGVGSVC
jgi:hypothetical protein